MTTHQSRRKRPRLRDENGNVFPFIAAYQMRLERFRRIEMKFHELLNTAKAAKAMEMKIPEGTEVGETPFQLVHEAIRLEIAAESAEENAEWPFKPFEELMDEPTVWDNIHTALSKLRIAVHFIGANTDDNGLAHPDKKQAVRNACRDAREQIDTITHGVNTLEEQLGK